jgi:hypothetical protein
MNMNKSFELAVLSRAAYATIDYHGGESIYLQLTDESRYSVDVSFVRKLSQYFFTGEGNNLGYTVIAQTRSDSIFGDGPAASNLDSGFSATLFKNEKTNAKTLAFRGTELTGLSPKYFLLKIAAYMAWRPCYAN